MDTWAASTSWLSWMTLLQTWVCKYLFKIPFSFLLGKYPEVELPDHMVTLFLIVWRPTILSSTAPETFYIRELVFWNFPKWEVRLFWLPEHWTRAPLGVWHFAGCGRRCLRPVTSLTQAVRWASLGCISLMQEGVCSVGPLPGAHRKRAHGF